MLQVSPTEELTKDADARYIRSSRTEHLKQGQSALLLAPTSSKTKHYSAAPNGKQKKQDGKWEINLLWYREKWIDEHPEGQKCRYYGRQEKQKSSQKSKNLFHKRLL